MAPLNLDALKRPPLSIVLGGNTHTLAAPALELGAQLRELRKAAEDPEAQHSVVARTIALIAPTLSRDEIGALEDGQATALIEHWQSDASARSAEDERDVRAVIEDPTSPG